MSRIEGRRRRLFGAIVVRAAAVAVLLSACGETPPPAPEPVETARTEVVVLTRYSPTTYVLDRLGRPAGLEYELASSFAKSLGLPVRFELLDSVEAILDALESGRGDMAAAGLTLTEERSKRLAAGESYQSVRQMIVCRSGSGVRQPRHLVGKSIQVIAASSYVASLRRLRRKHPDLSWSETSERSTEEMIQSVAAGELDCTVADSNIVAIDRRFFPQVRTPFAVSEEQSLTWYFSERGRDLAEPVREWMAAVKGRGELETLLDRYYSHVQDFDRYDTTIFYRRLESRLPRYRALFHRAAEQVGLPWTLLASVSYQESHWDPGAVSETGVRGLMMLTHQTALDLGVDDRTDPTESVLAGARYLQQQINRIPGFIPYPDRLWMGLAAYNVGYGHLEDARKLAVELRRNPNAWADVKRVLPLLSQHRYFNRLRHGYARGWEPVAYVRQVRNYHDLILQAAPDEVEADEL